MKGNRRQDIALLLLRIGLGLIILYFGAQKMLGVFGGMGYQGTVDAFAKGGIPPVFANLAIIAEFFGGLGVLLGFLTPLAAFGIACTMAVAAYRAAAEPGYLHTLFTAGGPTASAFFFPASVFFLALTVMILGAGAYSVDGKLFGGRRGK